MTPLGWQGKGRLCSLGRSGFSMLLLACCWLFAIAARLLRGPAMDSMLIVPHRLRRVALPIALSSTSARPTAGAAAVDSGTRQTGQPRARVGRRAEPPA